MKALTIGKLPILFLLMSISVAAQTSLIVKNSQGVQTDQIGVGQPFILEVQIDQMGGSIQYPRIKGLEDFVVHRSGFQLNTINGHATAYYTYQVRIDEPGNYTLGPAEVNGHAASNTVHVTVSDAPQVTAERGKPFLQLSVNKDRVFVGEKIGCTLRLYYTDKKMNVQSLGIPNQTQAQHVNFSAQQGPTQGTEIVDGVRYQYLEWQWNAYARQAGKLIVPAYYVDYTQDARQPNHHVMAMFGFLARQLEQKRMYSNAVPIMALALPDSVKKDVPIGNISQFAASLTPSVAKEGEGMVLTLAVAGDIDLPNLDIAQLHNMPANFKWYESKKYVENDTKYIEFIVQGLEPGNWQLPQQQLTYFDTETKQCKTLMTRSLPVTIAHNGRGVSSHAISQTQVDIEQKKEEQLPLDPSSHWYALSERAVPWRWFIICMASAAILWFFFLMRRYRTRGDTVARKKNRAFTIARTQLKQAEKKGDTAVLYQLFMNLFSDRLGIPVAELSQEKIKQRMLDLGFSEKLYYEWENFFIHIQEYSFFKTGVHDTVIFILAQKWLDELEKKI